MNNNDFDYTYRVIEPKEGHCLDRWVVICLGERAPTVEHKTRESAVAEAKRLQGFNDRDYIVARISDTFCVEKRRQHWRSKP